MQENGAKKVASVFYKAINRAFADGRIVTPAASDFIQNPGCPAVFGSGVYAGGQTQKGSGEHDGIYQHDAEGMGIIFSATDDFDRDQWRFARLFTRDFDDLVEWWEPSKGQNSFGVWKNSADQKGKFTKIADMPIPLYCDPKGIQFIDMNGKFTQNFLGWHRPTATDQILDS